jgi:hypothetical protein
MLHPHRRRIRARTSKVSPTGGGRIAIEVAVIVAALVVALAGEIAADWISMETSFH